MKKDLQTLKTDYKTLCTKMATVKTQRSLNKVLDQKRCVSIQIRDILFEQCEELNKEYADLSITGVVKHVWDNCIVVELTVAGQKTTVMASKCNDVLSKSWYDETCCIDYTKGQNVTVKLNFEVTEHHISIAVKSINGGKVNQEKYEELCKNKHLAFFKYPESDFFSGLL